QDESQGKIKQAWEKIKEGERQQKGHNSLMDDIPIALPSTVRAYKLQKRAASANFDWPSTDGVYSKVQEEIDELKSAMADLQVLTNDLNHAKLAHVAPTSDIASIKDNIEEELGDVFFTLINLSRHLKVEPETALRKANSKFEARFRHLEAWAQQQSLDISTQQPEVLEEWWQRAKKDLVE
ncbi:MAG: MazG nucleotide pyrophosphohydrolase domain-containing protein, partial [Cellvibrionaceae bacterium]